MIDIKKGIITALVTPYDKHGDVNYYELKKLTKQLRSEGVDGFYITGSTGEAFCMTDEERIKSIDAVCEEVDSDCYVIAHIGNIGTDRSKYLAKEAKKAGANAISSVPPFYYKFSTEEIKRYYFELADSTDLPFICYNFPSLSGVMLDVAMVSDLVKNHNIMGVKFTCNDFYQLERMRYNIPELTIYNGYDEMLLNGLISGADGAIGSTFNFMAKPVIALYRSFKKNEIKKASSIQRDLNCMIEKMVEVGVIASTKAILRRKGIECNGCRSPFTNATSDQDVMLAKIYDEHIAKYYNGEKIL